MAKRNPYKSEKIKIKTTTVWKNKVPSFGLHWIKVFYDLNLASQRSNLEILLLSKFWSKRGDFNFHDSQDYKFSCCGSFGLDFFCFIQMAMLCSQFAKGITIIKVANSVYSDDFVGRTSAIYERRSALHLVACSLLSNAHAYLVNDKWIGRGPSSINRQFSIHLGLLDLNKAN